jgi:hypothetical protein
VSNDDMSAARRKFEHGAVLGNDDVKAADVASGCTQVGQPSPGDQDDDDPTASHVADRFAYGWIELAIHRDRAIVVKRKGREFHDGTVCNRSSPVFGNRANPDNIALTAANPLLDSILRPSG